MYELKLNTWRLCKGLRLKTFLYTLFFALLIFSALLCLLTALLCMGEGSEKIINGIISPLGIKASEIICDIFAAVLFFAFAFFLICAVSLAFALKAHYCRAVLSHWENGEYYSGEWEQFGIELPKNGYREKSKKKAVLSFQNGIKYLMYLSMSMGNKLAIFARFSIPFWINLLIACIFALYFGFDADTFAACLCLLAFLLTFALVCTYYRSRQYDIGALLLCCNEAMSPKTALEMSRQMSKGELGKLTLYRLFLLPRKLLCILPPLLPYNLAYCGVFSALSILPKNIENFTNKCYNKEKSRNLGFRLTEKEENERGKRSGGKIKRLSEKRRRLSGETR